MSHTISTNSPSGNPSVATTSLEVAYDMETLDAGAMDDFSTNARNGTLVNSPTDVTGAPQRGQGRDFDNDADEATSIDIVDIDLTLPYTFAFWINPTAAGDTPQQVIAKDASGTQAYAVGITDPGDATLDSRYVNSGFKIATSTDTVSAGVWQHVAFIQSDGGGGTTDHQFFINGIPDSGGVINTALQPVSDNETTTICSNFNTSRDYHGSVDELVIFNRALSDAEIRTLAGGIRDVGGCGMMPHARRIVV